MVTTSVHLSVRLFVTCHQWINRLSKFHETGFEGSFIKVVCASLSFVKVDTLTVTLYVRASMNFCSHVSRLLTDLGEICCRRSARNVVQQLCVSWKQVRWKPFFTKGRKLDSSPPPILCLFFCPIRINVGTGDADKSVLSGYEVHENRTMESRTFHVVKVVPLYAVRAYRGVEA
jgi:hypothetical protein